MVLRRVEQPLHVSDDIWLRCLTHSPSWGTENDEHLARLEDTIDAVEDLYLSLPVADEITSGTGEGEG